MTAKRKRINMPKNKFLITQSLLSSWLYVYKTDTGYKDFLSALDRIQKPPTKAMLDGNHFEAMVNAVCDGQPIDQAHEWYKPITEVVDIVGGSQKQVRASKDIEIDGINFVLYGVLDFLKAGTIYDTKFSKTYAMGKYMESPQHPMYFELVPEAKRFEYVICDGSWVYREAYDREDVVPIQYTIKNFMDFLDRQNLVNRYCEKWRSKY